MANNVNLASTDKGKPTSGTENATQKVVDKVLEKRRALGRGLESLLGGPRTVAPQPPLRGQEGSVVASRSEATGAQSAAAVDGLSHDRHVEMTAHAGEAGVDVPQFQGGHEASGGSHERSS